MCGRFFIDLSIVKYLQHLTAMNLGAFYAEPEDKHPTSKVTVLRAGLDGIFAERQIWGFPGFAAGSTIFNARAESVLQKKIFSESVLYRRCIIPANGFYEWDSSKNKIVFKGEKPIIYMAGFWNVFNGQNHCAIITTAANFSIKEVHDRMPLILQEEQIHDWLCDQQKAIKLLTYTPTPLTRESEYYQESLFL